MLEQLLLLLESDRSLWWSFATRCVVSEQLDALVIREVDPALRLQAANALAQLEAADDRFFARLRERLRCGRYTPEGLIRGLWRYSERDDAAQGYAPLDVLLAGVLDAGELPDELPSSRDTVAYQPAPGRVILSLLAELGAGDVFYDLGSGLGRVVIAVALLTAARAKGVEFQPGFCAYAARAAEHVNARGVEFVALDVRDAALHDGTLFFLYTPFRGAMLESVLRKLRALAQQKPIRVCTFGPCTSQVAQEPWLALQSSSLSQDELAVFESKLT